MSTTAPTPEAMRSAMAAYVRAVHEAYLDASAALPPAERARLPLTTTDRLTVIAVGTRYLHVLATTEALPAPVGQEVELSDALPGLAWRLRFFDPVIAPGLGLIDEQDAPQPRQVRDMLGVRTHLYHLSVPPGSGLTPHHAQHAGTGLAHAHAAADRDFDSIAALVPGHAALVSEMHGAHVAGLPVAELLLARAIEPSCTPLQDMSLSDAIATDDVRRALLTSLRRSAS